MSGLARQVAAAPVRQETDAETQVREAIKRRLPTIKALLPDVLDERKLAALVLTEVHKNPELAQCDEVSLIGCVLRAAALGLQFGADLGQAYLIPRRNQGRQECTLQLGYRGVIALARRSGEIESIVTRSVYQGDHLDYEFGLNERLVHRPSQSEDRTDANLTHAYCVVHFRGGGADFEVLDRAQIEARRKRAKGAQPAWQSDYAKMAEKSAVLAMKGRLPLASEVVRALSEDGGAITVTSQGPPALEARFEVPAELEAPRQVDADTGEITPAVEPLPDVPGRPAPPDDTRPQTKVDVAKVLADAGIEPPLHLAVLLKISNGMVTDMAALTEKHVHGLEREAKACAASPIGFVKSLLGRLKPETDEAGVLAAWLAEQETAA